MPEELAPEVSIQWKGTNVCLDFYCSCGAAPHFDGYQAYVLRCVHCGQLYELPRIITPRRIASMEEATYPEWVPRDMRDDESTIEAN